MLIQTYPLSEWNFDDALIPFDSDNVLFNNLMGTNFGITDSLAYHMVFGRSVFSQIWITTAYIKVCFARRLWSTITTTNVLKYVNRRGVVTRRSKIYGGWNKNQDSPTPLYGVR